MQSASLVFVATKKEAEEFAAGLQALANTIQEISRSRLCTFIPKSFVRLIIHCCLCAKIATYLQNIGRGGRDDVSRMATHPFGDLVFIFVQILNPATLGLGCVGQVDLFHRASCLKPSYLELTGHVIS